MTKQLSILDTDGFNAFVGLFVSQGDTREQAVSKAFAARAEAAARRLSDRRKPGGQLRTGQPAINKPATSARPAPTIRELADRYLADGMSIEQATSRAYRDARLGTIGLSAADVVRPKPPTIRTERKDGQLSVYVTFPAITEDQTVLQDEAQLTAKYIAQGVDEVTARARAAKEFRAALAKALGA